MTSLLIQNLASFNRKERFHLLSDAFNLGQGHSKLSDEFTKRVATASGISLAIPNDAFWAMDYHLDWIYASLCLSGEKPAGSEAHLNSALPPFPRDGNLKISGTQEDIDFLIAFDDPAIGKPRMVLIEAKFDTAWSNEQLGSKAERLCAIFGHAENHWAHLVEPYFLIASPKKPENLDLCVLPKWARKERIEQQWFELKSASGEKADMVRVIRCDEKGNDKKDGLYWKVR